MMETLQDSMWLVGGWCLVLMVVCPHVDSLEEAQPALFLQPRNFNPHPYETGFGSRDIPAEARVGPVLFPPSPPDEDGSVATNAIGGQPQGNHPIDNHPYARVAQKNKLYNSFARFPGEDNEINPRVYQALSNHAAKVLSLPSSQLRKDYSLGSLSQEPKNYAFSYKVVDALTGDDFSHSQSQNARSTNGEYRVKLPDGRLQIVSYTADKNGYKADVQYRGAQEASYDYQYQDGVLEDYDSSSLDHLFTDGQLNYEPVPSVYVSTSKFGRNQQRAALVYGR